MVDKETSRAEGRVITSRLSTTKSISGAVTALIVCVGLFLWLSSMNLRLVRSVTGASPYTYPGITYEEAFGNFFSDPQWDDASKGNTKIVRFTGGCTYGGKPAKVVLNFLVGDKEFSLHDGTINGTPANILELAELNSRPFEEFKKK